MDVDPDLKRAQEISHARAASYIAALDPDINARDDRIAVELAHENASAKAKLGKIYRLLADADKAVKTFIACSRGCSSCCKMNVSITSVEAERLAALSGRRMARVVAPIKHSEARFAGVPCPFLRDDACSVYDSRPYACRAHYSFDVTAYWCHPSRAFRGGMGMVNFRGTQDAYEAIARDSLGGLADIRDFFPDGA